MIQLCRFSFERGTFQLFNPLSPSDEGGVETVGLDGGRACFYRDF